MKNPKQQFNVYLLPELIARTKHRAIDEQLSLSDFIAHILTRYLEGTAMNTAASTTAASTTAPTLTLQPMVHVEDLPASIAFYEALGATLITGSRDGDWAQLRLGGAEIGLLAHPANPEQHEGPVEMNFTCAPEDSLTALQERLEAAGVKIARGAADEAFGEQLQVEAPGGMLIKINKIDPATFE